MSNETHFIAVNNDTRGRFTLKAVLPTGVVFELPRPVGPNEKVVTDLGDYGGSEEFRLIFTNQDGTALTSPTVLTYNRNIDVIANFTVTAGDFFPFIVTFNGLEK